MKKILLKRSSCPSPEVRICRGHLGYSKLLINFIEQYNLQQFDKPASKGGAIT